MPEAVNQYNNKVVLADGTVLIDLTSDTVVANKLASGYTAHDKSGATITGTNDFDANTSDATATASEILATKTAYVNASKVTGTMPNRGAVTGTITTKAGTYTIPQGYHDGSGTVAISSTEQAKIVAGNIRSGITILGVEGSMTGTEDANAQTVSVTPTFTQQVITPDSTQDYNYLAQVTVAAIAVSYVDNAQGGKTVTIGSVAS